MPAAGAAVLSVAVVAAGTLAYRSMTDPDLSVGAAPPVITTSAAPATGTGTGAVDGPGLVSGTGYRYALPPGWTDGSDGVETSGLPGDIDTMSGVVPRPGGPATSLIVEVVAAAGAAPEDLREPYLRNATEPDGAEAVALDGREVAGTRAIAMALRGRSSDFDVPMDQVVYLMVHDGNGYGLAFSFPSGDTAAEQVVGSVLDTWTWSD